MEYRHVEAAYQAAKTDDAAGRRRIREAEKPGEAKKLGQKVKLREGWEQMEITSHGRLVREKFQDPDLREKLLATEDAYLQETTGMIHFWGVCRAHGKNHLGKILMKVRDDFKTAKKS